MKVATRVVALLAVLASATAANAATHVWFSAVATSPTASVVTNGSLGASTVLMCQKDLGPCTWAITMAFANDAGDETISGWSNALISTGAPDKVSVDQGSLVYAVNNFTSHAAPATYGFSPGPILRNANGQDFGAGGSGGNLGTFTLRKAGIGLQTEHIFLWTDDTEWATTGGNYPDMQAGGNATLPGAGGAGTDLGEVITIINFPEPSSLSLLGLGALALIRRRR